MSQNNPNHLGSFYKPLDRSRNEIRLLQFAQHSHQHAGKSLPNLTYHYVSLDDKLPYSAISYVWGEASDIEPIIVNGSVFQATRNLAAGLRALYRLPDSPSYFWADAICIDQQNIERRNAQVALMGRIYN